MKKENLIGLVITLLLAGAAVLYGFTVLQTHFPNSYFYTQNNGGILYGVYIFVSIIAGLFATGLLQGLGHLLGAKVGGYKIVFACLFHFCVYRNDEGKLKFKFSNYEGLTGETKIVPNYEKKAQPNPYPFLLYGTVFNVAWIIASIFTFFTFFKEKGIYGDLAYMFLTMALVAFFVALYNIIPMKLDSETDGYFLTKIKKDIPGFNALLQSQNGVTTKGENGEVISTPKVEKFIPEVALGEISGLLEDEQYEKVFETLEKIKEHEEEMSKRNILEATAQYIFAYMLTHSKTENEAYYETDVSFALRRELANDNNMVVLRTYLLIAGVLDGSISECLLAARTVVKAFKALPVNRKHSELILFNKSIDLVMETHPKWEELANYKLYE